MYRMVLLACMFVGCSDNNTTLNQEMQTVLDLHLPDALPKDNATHDKAPSPDAPLTHLKVAAIQYGKGDHTAVSTCSSDLCGLSFFVKQAASLGAHLVVTPERPVGQKTAEPSPNLGDSPATNGTFSAAPILKTFAKLAKDLQIVLVTNLITQKGKNLFATSVAFNDQGKIVARHYKYELFGNEVTQLTAGTSLKESFFDTPAGRAGLMICADAHCIVTDFQTGPSCTSHALKMTKDYFMIYKPILVLFSAAWTIPAGGGLWGVLNVHKKLASVPNSMNGVWVVGANNTQYQGFGGGVWQPGGKAVQTVVSQKPSVIYATIPVKK